MSAPAEQRMVPEFLAWCETQEKGHVLHYRRDGEAPITLAIMRDGSIRLDPPGLDLATSDIFA